uniref:Uncharacterized protein n=1 Tax=Nicotiana tabacum TaxID=4097 RepID=A0A1S4CHC8_TOBAC|nr:PREDICTED: uncharacterized protein LOC107818869 [Nicotiana tabacum]
MANTTGVVNADNNSSVIVVQFNPASQLSIKLQGSKNFAAWKCQSYICSLVSSRSTHQNALMTSVDPTIATDAAAADLTKNLTNSLLLVPITNSKVIVKILSGLGLEFREISTAIHACDSTITYEELYEKLLYYELFLRHKESKKALSHIIVVVATFNKSGNSNNCNNRCSNNNNGSNQRDTTIYLIQKISGDLRTPITLLMEFAASCATNQVML